MKIYYAFIIIILISSFSWMFYAYSQYPSKIREWAVKENVSVNSINKEYGFAPGPYSFWENGKGITIYKVETNKGVYWIKFKITSLTIQDVKR